MTRLRHSVQAYVRSLQISRAKLHIYVEGPIPDRYVYDKIAQDLCPSSWDYKIATAEEIPTGPTGGGKPRLRLWYEFLRGQGMLVVNFKSRRAVTAFIFDKDIDDVTGTRCRSPHVIYTRWYELENHLFEGGNLADTCASILGRTRGEIRAALGEQRDWRRSVATRWREWVELCLTAALLRVRNYPGYNSLSRVHNSHEESADLAKVTSELGVIQSRSGSAMAFHRIYGRAQRKVHAAFEADEFDLVFKGKWYCVVLEADLRAAGLWRPSIKGSFADRVVAGLALSVAPSGSWCSYVRDPLIQLLALI